MGGAKRGYRSSPRPGALPPPSHRPGPDRPLPRRPTATVHAVNRLTPTIIEVVLRAPAAARAFRPGQFYRLQNYEVLAAASPNPASARTVLGMEGLAMTGAWTDPARGLRQRHRAGNGRQFGPLRHAQARRARHPDGPDRHATEIHPTPPSPWSAAAWQRRPVLDRCRPARGRIAGDLLRRLQSDARPLQGRRDRTRRRRHRLVLRRGPRLRPDPARRTAASSAISCRPWRPTAPARWATKPCP